MALEFKGDAICLSGLLGTKLKSEVVGGYYNFWWGITSGGASNGYRYPTAIVELNAGTGEVYIKDTNETLPGSAGHALELKMKEPDKSKNLKIILVEENNDCYAHLKKVINRKWPSVDLSQAETTNTSNKSNIYLINKPLDEALDAIGNILDRRCNSLYFFDPLRGVRYETIEKVAKKRIRSYFKHGTEFFLFLFTSDWFLGRAELAPLPSSSKESEWTNEERKTVLDLDTLFGNQEWKHHILNCKPIEEKEKILIDLYKNQLHKWFRYVVPFPFAPKKNQLFHLVACSNYETGIIRTRDYYAYKTQNPRYVPNNIKAFEQFKKRHPILFKNLSGNKRPLEWKILWNDGIRLQDGICDCECEGVAEASPSDRQCALEWLANEGYLERVRFENRFWGDTCNQYVVNWKKITATLGIPPPEPLKPMTIEQISTDITETKKT